MAGSRTCSSACVRLRLGSVCTALLIALVPSAATAQQAAFAQALSELTAAVEGTYGDEGALVRPAIDRMSAALAQWDREIEAAAAGVRRRRRLRRRRLVDRRIALARIYADRGRLADALSELEAASRLEPRRANIHVLRGLVLEAAGTACRSNRGVSNSARDRRGESRDRVLPVPSGRQAARAQTIRVMRPMPCRNLLRAREECACEEGNPVHPSRAAPTVCRRPAAPSARGIQPGLPPHRWSASTRGRSSNSAKPQTVTRSLRI